MQTKGAFGKCLAHKIQLMNDQFYETCICIQTQLKERENSKKQNEKKTDTNTSTQKKKTQTHVQAGDLEPASCSGIESLFADI